MTKWYLINKQQFSENTPEYGHGDWPDNISYVMAALDAGTKRKAQNAFKKRFPEWNLIFGGIFSPILISEDDDRLDLYTKPADKRLSLKRQAMHNYHCGHSA